MPRHVYSGHWGRGLEPTKGTNFDLDYGKCVGAGFVKWVIKFARCQFPQVLIMRLVLVTGMCSLLARMAVLWLGCAH